MKDRKLYTVMTMLFAIIVFQKAAAFDFKKYKQNNIYKAMKPSETDKHNIGFGGGFAIPYFPSSGLSSVGLNLGAIYYTTERTCIYLGFNYFLGRNINYDTNIPSTDGSASVSVAASDKISLINFYLHFNKYFAGASEETFGLYFFGGFSIVRYSVTSSITGNYDKAKYSIPSNFVSSQSFFGETIDLGLGSHFQLNNRMRIYTDFFTSMPSTRVDESFIYNPTPLSIILKAGVRYFLEDI